MCIANSIRSQIAEAVARHYFPDRGDYQSCGQYGSQIHPGAAKVIRALGADFSKHWSKGIDEIDPDSVDVVVSLVKDQPLPEELGEKQWVSWPHKSPSSPFPEEREKEFQLLMKSIKEKLDQYFTDTSSNEP